MRLVAHSRATALGMISPNTSITGVSVSVTTTARAASSGSSGEGHRRGGDDVRDGHAHHGGGQEPLGMAERLEIARGDRVALLGQVAQPQAVGGDERHLGRREEHRGEQAEDGSHEQALTPPPPSTRACAAR
jgi:hypothetical protein